MGVIRENPCLNYSWQGFSSRYQTHYIWYGHEHLVFHFTGYIGGGYSGIFICTGSDRIWWQHERGCILNHSGGHFGNFHYACQFGMDSAMTLSLILMMVVAFLIVVAVTVYVINHMIKDEETNQGVILFVLYMVGMSGSCIDAVIVFSG
jgi:hypothetical protein